MVLALPVAAKAHARTPSPRSMAPPLGVRPATSDHGELPNRSRRPSGERDSDREDR
jgi:hypothetical protein